MARKAKMDQQLGDKESVFEQCDALIHRGKELKDEDLGLTKDGRRRWKVRPKALIHHDKKEIAAALRLKGQTWRQIAEILGITENSCRQWCKDDNYKEIFATLLLAFKEEQRNSILGYVPDAIRTLHDLLSDRSGHVRYEAAQALITHAALDQQVTQASSDGDFVDEIEKLRRKASAPNVQVNVGVMPAVPARAQIQAPVIEAEVREVE